jgi:hypothetical protein
VLLASINAFVLGHDIWFAVIPCEQLMIKDRATKKFIHSAGIAAWLQQTTMVAVFPSAAELLRNTDGLHRASRATAVENR